MDREELEKELQGYLRSETQKKEPPPEWWNKIISGAIAKKRNYRVQSLANQIKTGIKVTGNILISKHPVWRITALVLFIALVVSLSIVIPPMLSTDAKVMATDIALNSPEVINAFIDDPIESTRVIDKTDDTAIIEIIGGSGSIVTVIVNLNTQTVMYVTIGLQYYPDEDLGKVISILMSDNETKTMLDQGATINRIVNYHLKQVEGELTEKRVYVTISLEGKLYVTDIDFISGRVLEFGDYAAMEDLATVIYIADLYERLEDPNLSDKKFLEILEIIKTLGEKPIYITEIYIANLYERLEDPNLSDKRYIGILVILGALGEEPVIIKEPWLPEGLGIIFIRSFDSAGDEIYGMNADGSNQTNLTNNITDDSSPFLSPDGSQILFYSNRNGNEGFYAMNLDGSNQTKISDIAGALSPDRSKILFISDMDGDREIYVVDIDGSNQTRLTNNLGYDREPVWSPDGSQIAFRSYRDNNSEIYVMNADGSNQTNLTNNLAGDYRPAWSPDGSQISFYSVRDGNSEIYVVNADGSNQTRLTDNSYFNHRYPVWSNDGTRIAFEVYWGTGGDHREIYVMNADGSNQICLTNNSFSDNNPVWSPDDSMIAFVSQRDGDDRLFLGSEFNEIYVMNADGTNQTRLTNNSLPDNYPVWLPGSLPTPPTTTATITPPTTTDVPQEVVTFPDVNLEAAIREAINKPQTEGPIYLSDLEFLTSVVAPERGIIDLNGLEYCVQLKDLYLSSNNISDISPLAGLTNLKDLYLSSNNISDISPLASLTDLEYLNLEDNNISDISALRSRTNLRSINLEDNNISDISAVAGFRKLTQLSSINLSSNNISDISPLASLKGLGNFQSIYLSNNYISDISALAGFRHLRTLYLSGNDISDISALAGLTNLTNIDLSSNNISDISVLKARTNPSSMRLNLSSNNISDISALADLFAMWDLNLSSNNISGISALADLTDIRYLYLDSNNISDISALAGLTNLRELFLHDNDISDISALAGIPRLTYLKLDNNNIIDISILASLTRLYIIHLEGNSISDITPLVENAGLGKGNEVWLANNNLDLSEGSDGMQNINILKERGVEVHY